MSGAVGPRLKSDARCFETRRRAREAQSRPTAGDPGRCPVPGPAGGCLFVVPNPLQTTLFDCVVGWSRCKLMGQGVNGELRSPRYPRRTGYMRLFIASKSWTIFFDDKRLSNAERSTTASGSIFLLVRRRRHRNPKATCCGSQNCCNFFAEKPP